jgi:branched-chain amino acid transport system permease protein
MALATADGQPVKTHPNEANIAAVHHQQRNWLVGLLAVLAVLPATDLVLPGWLRFADLLPGIFCYAMLAIGLQVATGYTGLLHLGVAAFMGIGAYAYAILTCPVFPLQINPWLAFPLAMLAGALGGALLALPTMRLRGDYLAIVTLGFGEILQDALRNVEPLTKGAQGLNPLPAPTLPGFGPHTTYLQFYAISWGFLALVVLIVWRLRRSGMGRRWIAVREDELAARSMGVATTSVRLSSLVTTAAICALGGACFAALRGTSIEPGFYDFQLSVAVLCAVIVGGLGSLPGALLGALVMFGISNVLLVKLVDGMNRMGMASSSVFFNPTSWKYLLFGLALILMARWRPQGLLPAREDS